MSVDDGMQRTTYFASYKSHPNIWTGKYYKQLPSLSNMTPNSSSLPPAVRPKIDYHQMMGESVCLGIGTKGVNPERYLEPKPILHTAPPTQIRNHAPKTINPMSLIRRYDNSGFPIPPSKMDRASFVALAKYARWVTTSSRATSEDGLPVLEVSVPESTVESKADMVHLRSRKYDKESDDWQQAVLWDRIQQRPPVSKARTDYDGVTPSEKLLNKRQRIRPPTTLTGSPKPMVLDDLSSIYMRQCPGYGGFVPRAPTEGGMKKAPEQPNMSSSSQATYSRIPVKDGPDEKFKRKAPFSKAVTLTHPYNPYNKVDKKLK